jgi:hypothetical protein
MLFTQAKFYILNYLISTATWDNMLWAGFRINANKK